MFDSEEKDEASVGNPYDDAHIAPTRTALPVLEDLPMVSKRLYNEGVVLAEAGRFAAAITRWRAAIDMTPGNAIYHEHVAQAYMEMGHDFAAVQAAHEVGVAHFQNLYHLTITGLLHTRL